MLPFRVCESDFYGILFLQGADARPYDGYYSTISTLRPLLRYQDWTEHITGFYINAACNSTVVRLSYFSTTPDKVMDFVSPEIERVGLHIVKEVNPEQACVSAVYGGEELRFRRYLCCYTAIGLDLMEADLLHARRLMATFRWQVMRARMNYRDHLLSSLEKLSPTYCKLNDLEREQFWLDLECWPDVTQVDWAHFLVNMVLTYDWTCCWAQFAQPCPPLTTEEINNKIPERDFELPPGWNPNCLPE